MIAHMDKVLQMKMKGMAAANKQQAKCCACSSLADQRIDCKHSRFEA
jgi:hypothetical protein